MEQEPDSPILYDAIKRVGYSMRLGIHLLFIIVSFMGAAILLAALLIGN